MLENYKILRYATYVKKKLRIAVLAGGPSPERGISLNSARSVCDHLPEDFFEITPIYFDYEKNPYLLNRHQLYSNTPSDFDFKLHEFSRSLSEHRLIEILKGQDLCFPVIHGAFGEDGELQKFLEKNNIPFTGSPERACKLCFHKHHSNEFIRKAGFYAVPSELFMSHHSPKVQIKKIQSFFKEGKIKRAIVKPARGGSSIGVYSVTSPKEALEALHTIFTRRLDTQAVIEPFVTGKEFTVIILQNRFDQPVAVLPTEIETDYSGNEIFSYRRKYLPTRQVTYHCPPRFPKEISEKIQTQAEQLFTLFGMRNFARFDGWVLPDGNIWFSDFNPISGMEQNSFLFQQAAQIGMSHQDILMFILKHACQRSNVAFPDEIFEKKIKNQKHKKIIPVLFGGQNSERQVSLMSGTNVWLKLRQSKKYWPEPYMVGTDGMVWHLPYAFTLNHTVDEITESCKRAKNIAAYLQDMRKKVIQKLSPLPGQTNETWAVPKKMTLKNFINHASRVFLALHGGMGEDGTLQKLLARAHVPFNGSKEKASRLCMDKYLTGKALSHLSSQKIYVPEKKLVETASFFSFQHKDFVKFWKTLKYDINTTWIMVKPGDEGSSTGICLLRSPKDLELYVHFVKKHAHSIPAHTFYLQKGPIEMPSRKMEHLLFEKFIVTDKVAVIKNKLHWETRSQWIEITCGVLEKNGRLHAFNPSVTVSSGHVLSLEEKFQGGTGINITPPPQPFVKKSATENAKKRIGIVAKTLGLKGYARIDAFMHVKTGELSVIEVNTLPALTPSTVLFQQALAENPPIPPRELLERIVELSA